MHCIPSKALPRLAGLILHPTTVPSRTHRGSSARVGRGSLTVVVPVTAFKKAPPYRKKKEKRMNGVGARNGGNHNLCNCC